MKINNIDDLSDKFIWHDDMGLITQSLGAMAGSQKFYVNIDTVPPKAFSTKYHSHSQQEEFFLILDGNGTVRMNDVEYPVKKGDFISKLPAQNIAHTFFNSSDGVLVILDIGTVEKEDTCYYPDEEIYLHKSNGINNVFGKQSLFKDWTSNPNEKN